MNRRSLLLIAAIVVATTIPTVHRAKADSISFTESDTHHIPNVRWALDLNPSSSQPFASGYLSTTPSEESLHWVGGPRPTCMWTAEATKVTVSFPDTPDPSVIGANNWLAVGMFVQGQDGTWPYQDYGYYTVLVLDSGGNLWLDVGGYRTFELTGYRALMLSKTWQIQGLSRSTPVTLIAYWNTAGFIVWEVIINEVTYQPFNAFYNMRLYEPTAIESFFIGWANIPPMNTPFYVAYLFQFGVTSPASIQQAGWNALIEHPQWKKDGSWSITQQAQTMQGQWAHFDSAFMWGGESALVEVKCHNNDANVERYEMKFFYHPQRLAPNYYLWSHEPTTPPRPSGLVYGYTGTYHRYNVYSTDPEGTQIQFLIYWGDNTYASTDWVASGTTLSVWHAWSLQGTYNVKVCAFDYNGLQSDWSPSLTVWIYPDPIPGGGGYCPFVSVWDGSSYVPDNNVLPRSMLSNGTDVEDFYRLEQTPIRTDGKYRLRLSEPASDHTYFDKFNLLAVDHQSDVNIAATPEGEILTYKNPTAPASAVDNHGNSRLGEIGFMDGNVSDPATFFQGFPNDYLVLNFGKVESDTAKLILRDDMKKQDDTTCIVVQVKDGSGVWQTVETLVPRAYWSMEAVDLSSHVVQGQDFTVRLYWLQTHRLDYVGLDTTPQANYDIQSGNLVSATHSTQGDVKTQLLENDHVYAELLPGQQIQLEFTLPNNSKEERTYILYTEGRYTTIP